MQAQPVSPPLPLDPRIRERYADNGNGLVVHWLEAGDSGASTPAVILLHGFPELAFSWRHQLVALAEAGFYVVAPDQRGYGRTTGWTADGHEDLRAYRMDNLVRDVLGLLQAIGRGSVQAVVGHDFGSPVAAWGAMTRPDVFRSLAMLATPFAGLPGGHAGSSDSRQKYAEAIAGLAKLPRPRKHYQLYYSGPDANAEMHGPRQGLKEFLRGYYHLKSAQGAHEKPGPLPDLSAGSLARLPTYYVMDAALGMSETVAQSVAPAGVGPIAWLPEAELDVYCSEYQRTGFQGGLLWYRAATDSVLQKELEANRGAKIEVPSCFIAGGWDWGVYQLPGALELMQREACTDMRSVQFVAQAGHWVQQEQPDVVNAALLAFLRSNR